MNNRYQIAHAIASLKPGQRINIPRTHMNGVSQRSIMGGESPVDLVLSLVIGSRYEISHWEGPDGFTFERRKEPASG